MKKILIVEDDNEIRSLLSEYLSQLGYSPLTAENGLDGLKSARDNEGLSLIILDLMLPYQSGDSVLKKLREFTDIPVIILSAKSMVQSKIDLIKAGADDYMTKPFDLDELAVRIEALLRRSGGNNKKQSDFLTYKKLTLDTENKTASVNGNTLVLTSKEYAILELMLSNPAKLFSKSNIFESIWNEEYLCDDNTVKVHISNLRNKIKKYDPDEEYICTVWGMGYKLA